MPKRTKLNADGSDPYGTAPMELDIEEHTGSNQGEGRRRQYLKPKDYGKCPRCTAAKVAVIQQGEHWVWKAHKIATYGRARFDCDAAGVPICQLPEPAAGSLHYGGATMTCPCEGS